MGFFPEGALEGRAAPNTLVGVIKPLNPKSKCAMFAAARAGTIARRTWNGCAWNAAGKEVNAGISSTLEASQTFGVDAVHVGLFIKVWDGLDVETDEEATRMLIEAIEHVGLFTEPNMSKTARIVRGYAFKSQATKFAEQLDSGELTLDQIPGARDMEALLNA